eukprot:GFYU01000550.1.p1 GENE.GFYU01000550.1~~GFYU01000550.1.p1  ORF type:complete len:109 (+),score=16.90 GFYU01000550.1:172-498(+)
MQKMPAPRMFHRGEIPGAGGRRYTWQFNESTRGTFIIGLVFLGLMSVMLTALLMHIYRDTSASAPIGGGRLTAEGMAELRALKEELERLKRLKIAEEEAEKAEQVEEQ